MPYRTDTFRIAMAGPADMSGLIDLIETGALDPATIVAILVKTEGNGGVNDFTREYTCATLATTLAPYPAPLPPRSNGGSPWWCPAAPRACSARTPRFSRGRRLRRRRPDGEKRLAIGIAAHARIRAPRDRPLPPRSKRPPPR